MEGFIIFLTSSNINYFYNIKLVKCYILFLGIEFNNIKGSLIYFN